MKKLLLASTALVMSAGVAAADVTLSGDAWMGLGYSNAPANNKIQMISRARVTFTMSGETDTGMAFGASFRADNATNAANGPGSTIGRPNMTAGSVYISGDFGKLSMGDVASAADATAFRTRHIGVLENNGASRTSVLGIGATGTAALYEYSIDGFKVAAGVGQFRSGSQAYSIGASYSMDGYGVALGYERNSAGSTHILLSAQVDFDPVSVRAFAGRLSMSSSEAVGPGSFSNDVGVAPGDRGNQYGLDVHATFDATSVQLRAKRDFGGNNHIGAGVAYDLGGGARLGGSINRVSGGATTADFGLAFSF